MVKFTVPSPGKPFLAFKTFAGTVYLEGQTNRPISSECSICNSASGFFIKEDLVATNFHCIKDCIEIRAHIDYQMDDDVLSDHYFSQVYIVEGFTAVDALNDIAILKVKPHNNYFLNLYNYNEGYIERGANIFVAGNPRLIRNAFSDGIISSSHPMPYSCRFFTMTAPVSPGSSGGPVVNSQGQVIAMVNGTYKDKKHNDGKQSQNLNLAIPSFLITKLLNSNSKNVNPLSDLKVYEAKSYCEYGFELLAAAEYDMAIDMSIKSIQCYDQQSDCDFVNKGKQAAVRLIETAEKSRTNAINIRKAMKID